jgi:hypothetical protein
MSQIVSEVIKAAGEKTDANAPCLAKPPHIFDVSCRRLRDGRDWCARRG